MTRNSVKKLLMARDNSWEDALKLSLRWGRLKAAVELTTAVIEAQSRVAVLQAEHPGLDFQKLTDTPAIELISDCAKLIHEEIKEGLNEFYGPNMR